MTLEEQLAIEAEYSRTWLSDCDGTDDEEDYDPDWVYDITVDREFGC